MTIRYRSRIAEDRPSVNIPRRFKPRTALSSRLMWAVFCAVALMLAALPDQAAAQGRLDAQYEATLAGIPVGKGAWTVDIGDDQFSASASGGTAGLLKAFSGGSGAGA